LGFVRYNMMASIVLDALALLDPVIGKSLLVGSAEWMIQLHENVALPCLARIGADEVVIVAVEATNHHAEPFSLRLGIVYIA
jgi:hypothetical protein